MGLTADKLDEDWAKKETTESVMVVRVALQNLEQVAINTRATINGAMASESFKSVDPVLKTECEEGLAIANQLIAAFEPRDEFVNFKPTRAKP